MHPPFTLTRALLAAIFPDKDPHPAQATIQPLRNGFQDNHVYKVTFAAPEPHSVILKFPHDHRQSNLRGEYHTLRYLSGTGIPIPHAHGYGQAAGLENGGQPVEYLWMAHIPGTPMNWVYYTAEKPAREKLLRACLVVLKQLLALPAVQPQTPG